MFARQPEMFGVMNEKHKKKVTGWLFNALFSFINQKSALHLIKSTSEDINTPVWAWLNCMQAARIGKSVRSLLRG